MHNSINHQYQSQSRLSDNNPNDLALSNASIQADKMLSLRRFMHMLTYPELDLRGRIIQLWNFQDSLIGTVLDSLGRITIIPGRKIYNSLNPAESSKTLLNRLKQIGLRRWSFAYLENTKGIHLWPRLIAAGKDSELPTNEFTNKRSQLGHMFRNDRGHLSKDTSYNRNIIKEAATDKRNYVGKDKFGHDCYLKKRADGTQSWARVRNGVIVEGGLNEKGRPSKFINGKLVRWENRFSDPNQQAGRGRVVTSKSVFRMMPPLKHFIQTLQQTRLTSSYNSNHPHNPVPSRGTGGEIGGVACTEEYIEGLFDPSEALFENKHLLCFPNLDGGDVPFSDDELRQILLELSVGIYAHDTIPFFSLHFNQKGDLFPVIHPAYENTLVGRVIGMLDYIMKGYLNGGIYNESFIDSWKKQANWNVRSKSALAQLIDFTEYCKTHFNNDDNLYLSGNDLIFIKNQLQSQGEIFQDNPHEPAFFSDFSMLTNSFRIISKLNGVQKHGNLLLIDSDFDVLYTISPSIEYQLELDRFKRKYGRYPSAYTNLGIAFDYLKNRIHDHMVKLPICKKYFSMLNVINFLSSYLSTLKKHGKVPKLPAPNELDTRGCPSVFPALPVRMPLKDKIRYNRFHIFNSILRTQLPDIRICLEELVNQSAGYQKEPSSRFTESKLRLQSAFEMNVEKSLLKSCRYPAVKRFLSQNKSLLHPELKQVASNLLKMYFDFFSEILKRSSTEGNQIEFGVLINTFVQLPLNMIFDNAQEDFMKLQNNFINILPDLGIKKYNQNTVGGCGLRLVRQKVRDSATAKRIASENWFNMDNADLVSWTTVNTGANSDSQEAAFSLKFEDSPAGDNYAWMETLLIPEKMQGEKLEIWLQIIEAMREGNEEDFSALIQQCNESLDEMLDPYGRTLLHYAVQFNNTSLTKKLLDAGLDSEQPDYHGYLPLHYAAMSGSVEQAEILINAGGMNICNLSSKNGSTPLVVAVQHGQKDMAAFLLKSGAREGKLIAGYNLYHTALHHGYDEILDLFIEWNLPGINVNTSEGGTPLMMACELDSLHAVEALVQQGAQIPVSRRDGLTALAITIKRNCLPIADFLLKHHSPSNYEVEVAAKEGSATMISLVSKSVDVINFKNLASENLLHLSLRSGNMPVASYLLENGAGSVILDENNANETPLSVAIAGGFWEFIQDSFDKDVIPEADVFKYANQLIRKEYNPFLRILFQKYTFTHQQIQELLKGAAESGNNKAITLHLLPKGADLKNLKGPQGWGILHYLAKSDGIFLFRQLEEVETLDNNGKSLAYIAAENGSMRVLRHLINKMPKNGDTLHSHYKDRHLLYAAMESGSVDCLDMMLKHFSSANLKDQKLDARGTRPVHLAAKLGSKKMLKLLFKENADFSVVDHADMTPLCYAAKANELKAVKYLLKSCGLKVTSRALFFAVSLHHDKIEDLLISFVSDIDVKTKKGDTALMLATAARDEKAFMKLMKLGASPTCAGRNDWTPLHIASACGADQILNLLLQLGCQDKSLADGNNALHWACIRRHSSCIQLLIEAGFSLSEKNIDGETPISLAEISGASSIGLRNEGNDYQLVVDKFLTTLSKDPSKEILSECIAQLKLSDAIPYTTHGRKVWGTPLHHLMRSELGNRDILDVILQNQSRNDFNPNLQDSHGNTLAHLLLAKNISPLGIQHADLTKPNFKMETPLHIAAQDADSDLLEGIIAALRDSGKLDVNVRDRCEKTPIFFALTKLKESNVRLLMKEGANVDALDYMGLTPLIYACQMNHMPLVKMLHREGGACIDQMVMGNKASLLHFALELNDEEIVEYLVFNGADCALPNEDGKLPVHIAAVMGNTQFLRYLDAKCHSIEARTADGVGAIHFAAAAGKTEVVSLCHSFGESLNARTGKAKNKIFAETTPLILAAATGQTETVDWMLTHYAKPEKTSKSGMTTIEAAASRKSTTEKLKEYRFAHKPENVRKALVVSVMKDNADTTELLYDRGIDINTFLTNGMTGLHLASLQGSLQTAKYLLSHGADPFVPNKEGKTSLELAAENQNVKQFNYLLNHCFKSEDFDIDAHNNRMETLLHIAAKSGNTGHLAYLLAQSADLDKKDVMGFTPLYSAIKSGKSKAVRLLLLCGAKLIQGAEGEKFLSDLLYDDDQQIKKVIAEFKRSIDGAGNGSVLLHAALKAKCTEAVFVHCSRAQDINTKDSRGSTPLHIAVQNSDARAIKWLIKKGAQLNAQDQNGRTPLWIACLETKDIEAARCLIKADADLNIKDNSGITLLSLLKQSGEPSHKALLKFVRKNKQSS